MSVAVKGSKRYRESLKTVDLEKVYDIPEAVKVLKAFKAAKFDETVEVAIRLGIDPKKTEQLIRGSLALPKGIGKEKKVICFAEGTKADEARAAGATEVGGEDLAKKVAGGWTDFDVAIATPESMKFVGKLGRVLGPQGKMPTPKAGTVTDDVTTAVSEFRAGKIEFRTDAGGNIHAPIGKRSFPNESIEQNLVALIEHVRSARPASVKGEFVTKVALSLTMSPRVQVNPGA
jgi:large subunit ribosomal protein L1